MGKHFRAVSVCFKFIHTSRYVTDDKKGGETKRKQDEEQNHIHILRHFCDNSASNEI